MLNIFGMCHKNLLTHMTPKVWVMIEPSAFVWRDCSLNMPGLKTAWASLRVKFMPFPPQISWRLGRSKDPGRVVMYESSYKQFDQPNRSPHGMPLLFVKQKNSTPLMCIGNRAFLVMHHECLLPADTT